MGVVLASSSLWPPMTPSASGPAVKVELTLQQPVSTHYHRHPEAILPPNYLYASLYWMDIGRPERLRADLKSPKAEIIAYW